MTIELALLREVTCRGQEVGGPRLRGLLALLAGDLRTGCGTARLVDELWPDEQPANPTKALQVLVSRLRTQFGADLIISTPTGYRLGLTEEQVDSSALTVLSATSAKHSRAGDHDAALASAEAGLALWDGTVGGDAPTHPAADPVADLRAQRLPAYRTLVRARALALSRLRRHDEAIETLKALADEHPRDEEIRLELLRSEAATAGPSEALAGYETYRRALRDELGTDPGSALQAFHRELLRGESPAVRQGIPHEPNPLLGRENDIAAVAKLVRTSLVTSIVGPGGLGKTRLAYVVGREAEQRAVHVVGLAGVTDDAGVTAEVATTLGVGEAAWRGRQPRERDTIGGIVDLLGHGSVLLVLDNCEQVVDGVAELVHALVSRTDSNVRVLTTSRTPLGLSSESVYPLPELDLPTAVALFEQRARAARPGVELPRSVVDELCRHLDGLPLAVELAAARVRVLSVPEIARRLTDRFALLRGGGRDVPERHQTLHAVVDWSWNLLEPSGQAAMRALSIFPSGFTADAAQHLLGDQALEVLEQLVDQSLLKAADTPSGLRFRMLETVREFSAAQLAAAGETDQAIDGFLAWARAFGIAHHDVLFGPDPYLPVARLRAEQDNLIQAMRHALARDDGGSVAATSAALGTLLASEGNYSRMGVVYEECGWLLSHYRPEPELVEATRTVLMLITTFTLLLQGPQATRAQVALSRLPPASPDTMAGAAAVLINLPPDDPEAMTRLLDSDRPLVVTAAAAVLSYFWEGQGDMDQALAMAQRMLQALQGQNIPWLEGLAHTRVSELGLQTESGVDVRYHLTVSLPVLEKLGSWADAAGVRWWLVLANLQLGALDEAERWMEQAYGSSVELGEQSSSIEYDLAVRAELLLARGEVEEGLQLWRHVADRVTALRSDPGYFPPIGLDPWEMEATAVAVVAHSQHRRLELVESITSELPEKLAGMLANPTENPPPYLMEGTIWGTLLLALAMVELDRGERTGDKSATRAGVRMIALAERLRYLRYFRPTMSSARIRQAALDADRPAYEKAVSTYANLDRDGLRVAALDVVRASPGDGCGG